MIRSQIISLFLAFVFISGTITAIFPSSSSFMIEVHALSEYGIQDNYKSTKDSSNLNKIKCINTNININGVNSGDVNVGNKDQLVQERYLSAKTFGQMVKDITVMMYITKKIKALIV